MLAYLQGVIKERQNGEMILLVGGDSSGWVGYRVLTPDHPRYEVLIPGERAELYLYSHIREDAFDLYGFQSPEEKNLYTTLLSVSGVGPKMALALLSHTDDQNLIEMIISEDKAGLTAIPGVGKKTAERMVLELKDSIQKKRAAGLLRGRSSGAAAGASAVDRSSGLFIEAYLALQGLGYREPEAKQMVEGAFKKNSTLSRVEEVIRVALQGGLES